MNRTLYFVLFASWIVSAAILRAEPTKSSAEAVTIPLDQIWAYEMPGTRDIRELEKQGTQPVDRSLVNLIGEAAVQRAEDLRRIETRPGFAVAGTSLAALRAAYPILVEGKKPRDVFSPDDEITLLFFSEPATGSKVHIAEVERREGVIVIRYRLKPYYERNLSGAFALIPLGKLPVGKYYVKIEPLLSEKKPEKDSKKSIDQFLCQPFSFRVK